MTVEDIQEDIMRMDFGDPEVYKAFEYLRQILRKKGLPYREVMASKTFNTVKYLVLDDSGNITITDLDTNESVTIT